MTESQAIRRKQAARRVLVAHNNEWMTTVGAVHNTIRFPTPEKKERNRFECRRLHARELVGLTEPRGLMQVRFLDMGD